MELLDANAGRVPITQHRQPSRTSRRAGRRLTTIPNAGHLAGLEQPAAFAALVGEFIRARALPAVALQIECRVRDLVAASGLGNSINLNAGRSRVHTLESQP